MLQFLQFSFTKENTLMFMRNFFLFFFGMAIIYSFYLYEEYQFVLHEQDTEIQSDLKAQVKILDNTFALLKMNLNYLAQNEHTDTEHISIDEIKQHFLTFADSYKYFQQIRWLDLNGRELVRVDKRDNKAFINENLQDKSKRYYYLESRNLKEKEIYLSPLDLNVEHGMIEEPHRPVIRLVQPLFINKKKAGYIIVNYCVKAMFSSLKEQKKNVNTYMLNKDGDYLLAPDENLAFSFMYGKSKDNFNKKYKKIWDEMLTKSKGVIINKDSTYHYTSYDPVETVSPNRSVKSKRTWYLVHKYDQQFIFEKFYERLHFSFHIALPIILITLFSHIFTVLRIRDIEQQKKIIKSQKKAIHASQVKSEFLANMSHEIRTPMTGLLGFIDQLSKTETDPKRVEKFKTARASGETLLDIINDILDFSKIESGKLTIESYPFNIKELFNNTSKIFIQIASSKNINVIHTMGENIPSAVLGDEIRLKQVLFNLLSNAIKFTNNGGTVTMHMHYNEESSTLYFSIMDTGVGIAKDNFDKIFQAFSQEDISTTRKFGGTGLGLSISSRLVSLMGGELKVESKVGQGSKFYFELPIAISSESINSDDISTEETQESDTIDQIKAHVLVVEDNKTNQMLMSMILDDLGVTYDITNDGAEGVFKTKLNSYDIILMDENMPIMNGIEATKTIRENEEETQTHIPIIAVTANALTGDKEKFIEAGMDDYLSKPYTEEDIAKVLRKYLA